MNRYALTLEGDTFPFTCDGDTIKEVPEPGQSDEMGFPFGPTWFVIEANGREVARVRHHLVKLAITTPIDGPAR